MSGSANVAIFGTNTIARYLIDYFIKSPLNNILCIDVLQNKDNINHFLEGDDDCNNSKVKFLGKINADSIYTELQNDGILDYDFAINCIGIKSNKFNYILNSIAAKYRFPVIYLNLDSNELLVLPLNYKNRSPCYCCFRLRRIASSRSPKSEFKKEVEDLKDKVQLHSNQIIKIPPNSDCLFENISEILNENFLSNATFKYVLKVDIKNYAFTKHHLYPLGECPICSDIADRKINDLNNWYCRSYKQIALDEINSIIDNYCGIISQLQTTQKICNNNILYFSKAICSNYFGSYKHYSEKSFGSGKSTKKETAEICAISEALEEYSATSRPQDNITYAPRDQLDSYSMDPRELVLYSESQYLNIPYSQFRSDNVIGWMRGFNLSKSKDILVPASSVMLNYSAKYKEEILFQPTSNGLSAHSTYTQAILSGLYEIIERDSLLLSWFLKIPGEKLIPELILNHRLQDLLSNTNSKYKKITILKLKIKAPCFVIVTVIEGSNNSGPKYSIGASADMDIFNAIENSFLEALQVQYSLELRLMKSNERIKSEILINNPQLVQSNTDHSLFYSQPKSKNALSFFLKSPLKEEKINSYYENYSSKDLLEHMVSWLESKNYEVLAVDITPHDLNKMPIKVMRVYITKYQPLHFGIINRRLGGDRLAKKVKCRCSSYDNLKNTFIINKYPHPLS